MSRTRKPCPGCGEVHPYRPAAEVCGDCQRKLKNEAHLREALEKRPDLLLLAHSSTYHWNPCFYGQYHLDSHDREELARTFHDLVRCISAPVGLAEWALPNPSEEYGVKLYLMERGRDAPSSSGDSVYGPGPENCVRVTPEQQIAIRRLFRAIDKALASAYAEGKHAGGNFIRQLATGEVSMADYREGSRP